VLHKQYGKEYLMQRNHSQYYRKATSLWISPFVESKDGAYFAILLTLGAPRQRSCGKAGEIQILRCQGIAVAYYSFILDALSLKRSGFCNVGEGNRKHGHMGYCHVCYHQVEGAPAAVRKASDVSKLRLMVATGLTISTGFVLAW
jgi:hypothetical protein